jgi:hypothetical protein
MTILIANVSQSTDSFGQWLTKTNQALFGITYRAVTTNSNTAVGNAGISGTFTANIAFANSSVKVGFATTNTQITNTTVTIQTNSTTNTVYSANGLIINGATQYQSSIMKIGNTTIKSGNVTSNVGYFDTNVIVGNTILFRDHIYTDSMNVKSMYAVNASIGDAEANIYMDRYGLSIFANPTGSQIVNSYMTSTDLWIQNIHSNGTIEANNLTVHGRLNLNGDSGNLVFTSNVTFLGQNNYFAHGLTSNGNVGIGVGTNGFTPLAPLHMVNGFPISARPINSNTIFAIETTTSGFIEFRASADTGIADGILFVDNNQGGYVVYNQPGGSAGGYGDRLRLGGFSGINFEVGGQDTADGVASKPIIMQVDAGAVSVNTAMRFLGATSGYTELIANSVAGSTRFTLPTLDGSPDQVMITDGAGKLGWKTVSAIPPATTDLRINSLGVGCDASGVTGEIRATNDITAFFSSDRSLKTNIKNIDNALDKITKINGVSFDWTDDILLERGGEDDYFNRKHDVGVIAQEIEQVLPEVVGTRENGIKAVKYDRIVALLIEGIKELKAELDEVKKNGGCNCGCK